MAKPPSMAGLPAIHPGTFLKEGILPGFDRSKVEIAAALGIERRGLYKLLNGEQAVTPDMALRLAKLFGTSAETWLRLQATYDLKIARERMADVLKDIPRWTPTPPA